MLLSIIIPSFRQGALLKGALESIESQSFKDYEILIMDAGSEDDTIEVINSFTHIPVRLYSEPDKGIYDAMNKGIDRSLGKFIYFMGCDDRLASPAILEEIFNHSASNDKDVIYGDVIFPINNVRYDGEFTYFKLFYQNICHQAVFVQKRLFDVIGKFDVRYSVLADWEFNMRWFSKSWVKRQYIPVVVAYYSNLGLSSTVKDDIFFSEESNLKKKHFPKIVRYLLANLKRPLHYRAMNFLTFEHINIIEKITAFLHL